MTTCAKCNHAILPGQLYHPRLSGPCHVACPTEREVAQAQRFGRWS